MVEPRLIVPLKPVGPQPFDPPVGKDPTYHGGPLLTNVHVQPVFWGNAWSQQAQSALPGQLAAFFQFIVTSSVMDMLGEYNAAGQAIGHGAVLANVLIPNSEPGGGSGTVADSAIQAQVDSWVQSGVLPNAVDALYFLFLPPGITTTSPAIGTSCKQYCGYHSRTQGNNAYAVMPFVTCNGCTRATQLQTFTVISTHELCEAVTNSNGGWWDSSPGGGQEIGDFCAGNNLSVTTLGGYLVQRIWSNEQNTCAIAPGVSLSSPVVFGRSINAAGGKKSIYVVRGAPAPPGSGTGTISQYWDTNVWNRDFPPHATAIGAYPNLQFVNSPAVLSRDGAKKSIYAVTNNGRLVQMWDTGIWNIDFPAEAPSGNFPAGFGRIRFQGTPAVFGREPTGGKKAIYIINTTGRLVQLWDTDVWNADFPAEKPNGNYRSLPAAQWNTHFVGSPTVMGTANQSVAEGGKKSIYAVNADGNLVQLWDTDVWNGDFPAQNTAAAKLRFQGNPSVFARQTQPDAEGGKKSVYVITTRGRLVQLWDTDVWNADFPAEVPGGNYVKPWVPRFKFSPAVFGRQIDPESMGGKKSIYVINVNGTLAQLWDTDVWNGDFPLVAP